MSGNDYVAPLLGLSSFICAILALKLITKKRPIKKNSKINVTALYIYPIKSCKGVNLDSAQISKRGFLYDRLFMVIDENGKFVSQRTQPKMCVIETEINFDLKTLTISAPSIMPTVLTIPLDGSKNEVSEAIRVTVWGDECIANEAFGEEGNRWFQKCLDTPSLRLVRMSDDCVRKTDEKFAPESQVAFSDGFPFLLCSNSSITALNQKLDKPIPITNFRPNIIVDCEEPFAEDKWSQIEFHHTDLTQPSVVPMKVVKPCSRCKVPTIDQTTAQFDPNNEPSRSMKSFRSGEAMGLREESWRREVFFGQNVDHGGREYGEVRVGDALVIRSYNKF